MTKTMQDLRNELKDYNRISAMYDAAKTVEEEKTACKYMQDIQDKINEGGQMYAFIFRLYQERDERHNTYITLEDADADKAEELVKAMQEYGITEFVFTSTWSGSANVAWALTEAGCECFGMTTVNSQHKKSWRSDEREEIPGYCFRITGHAASR